MNKKKWLKRRPFQFADEVPIIPPATSSNSPFSQVVGNQRKKTINKVATQTFKDQKVTDSPLKNYCYIFHAISSVYRFVMSPSCLKGFAAVSRDYRGRQHCLVMDRRLHLITRSSSESSRQCVQRCPPQFNLQYLIFRDSNTLSPQLSALSFV